MNDTLHKNANGDTLIKSDAGDGYTVLNSKDVVRGHISAEKDDEAIDKFMSNELDEDFSNTDEYRIERYEVDIPELFHGAHDSYMKGDLDAKSYADALQIIYDTLDSLDFSILDEAQKRSKSKISDKILAMLEETQDDSTSGFEDEFDDNFDDFDAFNFDREARLSEKLFLG